MNTKIVGPTSPLKIRPRAGYGWKKDPPDHRDFLFGVQRPDKVAQIFPAKIDLRDTGHMPPPYKQYQTSSCTAQALAGALEYLLNREIAQKDGLLGVPGSLVKPSKKALTPSRLFIYWNERFIEGTVEEDCGAYIRDGIKAMAKVGSCDEKLWPFEDDLLKKKPSAVAFKQAKPRTIDSYMKIRTLEEMRGCLASGYPFTVGFTVFEGFEGSEIARTGILKIPLPNEAERGGHAVLVIGYDDTEQRFLLRNSWGDDWGMGGYFTAPYEFIASPQYSSDYWTIRKS